MSAGSIIFRPNVSVNKIPVRKVLRNHSLSRDREKEWLRFCTFRRAKQNNTNWGNM